MPGKTIKKIKPQRLHKGDVIGIAGHTLFPIISNFPCGHGKNLMTMPISISARLVCDEQGVKLSFLESLTED